MRLSMEEVQKQHESTKKLYEQGLTVAPVDVKQVIDLYDTIEALQQENEQLQAQVARVKEVLRKVRETLDYWRELYGIGLEVLSWHVNGYIETFDSFYDSSGTYKALAEIDKVIGGYEEAKAEGRLIMPPCKVGDNVYFLLQEIDGTWYVSSPHRITEIGTRGFWLSAFPLDKPNAMDDFTSWSEFGKTVFLTKEEAEKALEMKRRGRKEVE